MLVFSLIGPATGTAKFDIFKGFSFSKNDEVAMNKLWRLNQYTVNLTQDNWSLLKISRCKVDDIGHWLHWIGLYSSSPISPDGREGYYIGVGICTYTMFETIDLLYKVLTRALNNYQKFIEHYRNTPEGFVLSNMRLDRINLSEQDMEDLQASERPNQFVFERTSPLQLTQKILSNIAIDTFDGFRRVYNASQSSASLQQNNEILASSSATLLRESITVANKHLSDPTEHPNRAGRETDNQLSDGDQARISIHNKPTLSTKSAEIDENYPSVMLSDPSQLLLNKIIDEQILLRNEIEQLDNNIDQQILCIGHQHTFQRWSFIGISVLFVLFSLANSLIQFRSSNDGQHAPTPKSIEQTERFPVVGSDQRILVNSVPIFEQPQELPTQPAVVAPPQKERTKASAAINRNDSNQQFERTLNIRNQFSNESLKSKEPGSPVSEAITLADRDQQSERALNVLNQPDVDSPASKGHEPPTPLPVTGTSERLPVTSIPAPPGVTVKPSLASVNCQNHSTINTLRQIKSLTSQVTDPVLTAYLALLGDLCPPVTSPDIRPAYVKPDNRTSPKKADGSTNIKKHRP